MEEETKEETKNKVEKLTDQLVREYLNFINC